MSLQTIQFTQEQARDLAGVSPGEVRAWRKAVAYLAAKPGKAARFSFADILGLAITRRITGDFHVRISDIGDSMDALFRTLSETRPSDFEGSIALIDAQTARLVPGSDLGAKSLKDPTFVVPCDQLIHDLSQRVMPLAPASLQAALPFAPQMVKAGR
ncbi:hypothetical protein [uncultured Methylobacterium sp.]|jgi:hypothetical protein|uniref:hypothetical protein n=1 Tax=uncultured Methylobacterium sp. TaxID=157278 RepID=UPI00262AAC3E|nr:hypothetical protein [uncultured Methylobacterium sp.]